MYKYEVLFTSTPPFHSIPQTKYKLALLLFFLIFLCFCFYFLGYLLFNYYEIGGGREWDYISECE